MEGTHHPLKKSPSQTKLGIFTPDSPDHGVEAGGESSLANKMASEKMHPSPAPEGGHGIRDKDFETLYQFDPTALTRPASAFECGPYPRGKLFDPIFEILQADHTLKRASEEQLSPVGAHASSDVLMSYKDIEKVTEMDTNFNMSREEASRIAEEIISDMEQDLVEVLKFKGVDTFTPSPSKVGRFYV